jgi:4-hydroxybenzoate polyprenyltransferase
VLGFGLSIAPVGGFLAVEGRWSSPWWMLIALSLAVTTWTGGFDVLYALQDVEFDRDARLHSLPAAMGEERAVAISRVLHCVSILCLAFVGAACLIFLNAAVAISATLLMALVQYVYLRSRVADSIAIDAPVNAADRAEVLKVVKSYLATAIFFCTQGQLVVWLVSIFGSTGPDSAATAQLRRAPDCVGSVSSDVPAEGWGLRVRFFRPIDRLRPTAPQRRAGQRVTPSCDRP